MTSFRPLGVHFLTASIVLDRCQYGIGGAPHADAEAYPLCKGPKGACSDSTGKCSFKCRPDDCKKDLGQGITDIVPVGGIVRLSCSSRVLKKKAPSCATRGRSNRSLRRTARSGLHRQAPCSSASAEPRNAPQGLILSEGACFSNEERDPSVTHYY